MLQMPTRATARPIANLDLLRSIAVAYVIVFHLLLFFRCIGSGAHGPFAALPLAMMMLGHLGVLFFFVHTSYVLMLSLERHGGEGGLFRSFMLRRIFRLFPASALIVLAIVLLKLPVAHLLEGVFLAIPIDWRVLLANLLLVQNLVDVDSVIATLWSLPYELQMYLVLPALFLLSRRFRSPALFCGAWLATAVVLRLTLPRAESLGLEMPLYLPVFLAGVLAYAICDRLRSLQLPWMVWPTAIAALTLVYLARPTVGTGWAACLCLGVLIPSCGEVPAGALRHGAEVIARYSYGIYLSHFACLWFAFQALASMPLAVRWGVFLITGCAIPIAIYHWIEAPFIALGARWLARGRTAPVGMSSS
jgi:peptidoglycan/LPS O-acetylase OafA/YrhL